jgi:hypothetical protein
MLEDYFRGVCLAGNYRVNLWEEDTLKFDP